MSRPHITITQDEINWATPRTAHTARRQCRACDLTYVVSLAYDGPPLCEPCRADLGATRAALRRDLAAVLAQMDAEIDTWDALREAHPAYWAKIQDARQQADFPAKAAYHRAHRNVYGRLLDAEAAYVATCDRLGAERARLERALDVLDTL